MDTFEQYAELVRKVRAGDENAFTDIYEKSKRLIYVTCYEILGNEQDAEDAMQEAYIKAYRNLDKLNDDYVFLKWLSVIAYHKALDKKESRGRKAEISYDDAIDSSEYMEEADLENLPEEFIVNKEGRETFHRILKESLSDVQYETVMLHHMNGLAAHEIAGTMGCTVDTVKSRLKLAKNKIRKSVEEFEKKSGTSLMAGAAGVPFLTRFFGEYAQGLKIPDITPFTRESSAPKSSTAEKKLPGESAKNAARESAKNAAREGAKNAASAGAKNAAALGAKNAAAAGFFGTAAGKITVGIVLGTLGLAGIGGAAVSIKNRADTKTHGQVVVEDEVNKIEETVESLEALPDTDPSDITAETSAPEETEETSETLFAVGDIPVDQVPEAAQLLSFMGDWSMECDRSNVADNVSVLHLLSPMADFSDTMDLRLYFDDYRSDFDFEDPMGLWTNRVPRVEASRVEWVESNILGMSSEDIARVNGSVPVDPTEAPEPPIYLSSADGCYYFQSLAAGDDLEREISSASYDGQYFTIVLREYLPAGIFGNEEEGESHYRTYVMELKDIDGRQFWSLVSCGATQFEEPSEETSSEINNGSLTMNLTPEIAQAYVDKVRSMVPDDFANEYQDFPDDTPVLSDIVDINGDEIPELVCSIEIDAEAYIRLFTWNGSEVIPLGDTIYQWLTMVEYVPSENFMVTGGGRSEAGAVWYSTYERMNDACDGREIIMSVTRACYDLAQYNSISDVPQESVWDEWLSFRRDDATGGYVRLTDEELARLDNHEDRVNLIGTMTADEFAASVLNF